MAIARPHPQARRIVPEVVQTSIMDCGPASLLALLQGFDLSVSYGRLREACQTSVDGTSISTMDEVANLLGLETDETILPADHLLLPEARALPAIVVVQYTTANFNHFVLVWSVVGPWVQIMDPAQGRLWVSRQWLLDRLYIHRMEIDAEAWRAFAGGDEFQSSLDARLAALAVRASQRQALRSNALAGPDWRGLAALDAATRMVAAMVEAGALGQGDEAHTLIARLARAASEPESASLIPSMYWSVLEEDDHGQAGSGMLLLRGSVLVRACGRRAQAPSPEALPEALSRALIESKARPGRTLLELFAADGLTRPVCVSVAVAVAALLVLFEAVLFRGFIELGGELALLPQRAGAMTALLGLLVLSLALDLLIIKGALAMGRALEMRLRMAFLAKIPRLGDRYFHSRLLSDMAERGHSLHMVRDLPVLGVSFLRACVQILFTVVGIAWLAPEIAPLALLTAVVSIGLPLLLQPIIAERDLKLRSYGGGLVRFYLDALLGLVPIRVHAAQKSVQHQQEHLLIHWARAALAFQATITWVEGVLALAGFSLAVVMVMSVTWEAAASMLLLTYWALSLPGLGQQVALTSRQYPVMRNIVLRLLEPLNAPDESNTPGAAAPARPVSLQSTPTAGGVAIRMREVRVEAGGHTILEGVDLGIESGQHVAIVGSSGAGKSSLVGLLLGWHRPERGSVEVDDQSLSGHLLGELRQMTAWVDPEVQLWNRSFLDNVCYGARDQANQPIAQTLDRTALRDVLQRLPDGLQTRLGEGGSLVSGGEGQRVRLGRAFLRKDARLVILDEAFRGLDRGMRRELLAEARAWWRHATLLCVTHDIDATEHFDRVLVVEGGRIVEDGAPAKLLAREGSRYAELMDSYNAMRDTEWSGPGWRRLWLEGGALREEPGASKGSVLREEQP